MAELDRYTQKAVDDPQFRSKVLKDANKAIKEEFGYDPPYKITYHISDESHIVFCLPPEDGALDDNDLSNIAGGQVLDPNMFNGGGFSLIKKDRSKPNPNCGYMCF